MRSVPLLAEQRRDETDAACATAMIRAVKERLTGAEKALLTVRATDMASYAAAFERAQVLRSVLEDVQSVAAKHYDI